MLVSGCLVKSSTPGSRLQEDMAGIKSGNCTQIGANMQQGMIQKEKFKIVYVAPMKALAAEMTATFSKRLASLGKHLAHLLA